MSRSRIIHFCLSLVAVALYCSFSSVIRNPDTDKQSLLWEISGNNIVTSSYLYGTIHLICEKDLEVPEVVFQSLQKSEQLALELNMTDPDFQKEFQKGIIMQDGSNLRKLLDKDDFKLVSDFFRDSLGVNLQEVGVVKPIFMNSMMYNKILGCQPQAYEMELINIAVREAKGITGIETLGQQLELFNSVSYKKQAEMLVESIKNFEETKKVYQDLLSLYKKQDIEGAYQLITGTPTAGIEDFEQLFLKERNERWIPVIEDMVKEKATFFAVGAGHLAGKEGLISLLQKRGYTVRPIKYVESFQKSQQNK